MSAVRHGLAVKAPCVRCLVAGEHMVSDEMASERSVGNTNIIRSRFLKLPSENKWSVENVIEVAQ